MSEDKVNRFQVKGKTKFIKGSILTPEGGGLRFVLNVVNMTGKAEGALYPIFDKKWKKVREETRGWYATKTGAYKLGATSTTAVQSDVWVTHLLCQDEKLATDVKALEECLKSVCKSALYEKATVHVSTVLTAAVPELEALLGTCLVDKGVSVSFYQEP
jgi:hypothetical protein